MSIFQDTEESQSLIGQSDAQRAHTEFMPTLEVLALDSEDVSWVAFAQKELSGSARFSLAFASAYEPYLIIDGQRIKSDHHKDDTASALWLYRHLFSLYQALGINLLASGRTHEGAFFVESLYEQNEKKILPTGALKVRLRESAFALPTYVDLGAAQKGQLMPRLKKHFASGARVEVRAENHEGLKARSIVTIE